MMKLDLQSCGFDSNNLDDWLESDLKQSGILPSDHSYNMEDPDWERHSDGSDDKTVVGDFELDSKKHPLPTQLAPILTALAVLSSLQPLPLAPVTPPLTPEAINPMHVTKTPMAPPLVTNTSTKRQNTESLDPLALKRQKNTDAARRSRQRKVMKMEALESRVMELEKHNEQLLLQVAVAENERDAAKLKESKQREKVAALEAQLAKSHQALLQQKQSRDEPKDEPKDEPN